MSLEGRIALAHLLLRAFWHSRTNTGSVRERTFPKPHQLGRSSPSLKVFKQARPPKVSGPTKYC